MSGAWDTPLEAAPTEGGAWDTPLEATPYEAAPGGTGSVSWGDWGRAAAAGTMSFGGAVAGFAEYLAGPEDGQAAGAVREMLQGEANYQTRAMGPEAQRALGSSLLPGEDDDSFWQEPIRALGMKAVNTLPSMVASIFPAAVVARSMAAAGASAAAVRAGAGAAVGGTNMAVSGGSVFADMAAEFGGMDEEEKLKGSPTYKALRDMGMDDEEATRRTITEAAGFKPIWAGMVAAAAGYALTGRAVADITTGGVRGVGRAAATGAKAEGGEEAFQTAAEEGFSQFGINELTGKPLSLREFAASVMEGAMLGAVMGGGMGAVGGAIGPARGPDAAQQAALSGEPIAPAAPEGNQERTDPDDPEFVYDAEDDEAADIDGEEVLNPPGSRPDDPLGPPPPTPPAPPINGMAASQPNPPAEPDQASRPGANRRPSNDWYQSDADYAREMAGPAPPRVENNIADQDQLAALAPPGQTAPTPTVQPGGAATPTETAVDPATAGPAPTVAGAAAGGTSATAAPQLPVAPIQDNVQTAPAPTPQVQAAPPVDVTPPPTQPPTGPGPAAPAVPAPQQGAPQDTGPVTPGVTPAAPIKLTGPQQGALQRLEGRAQDIARAEKVPDDLFEEILADLRNELEPQLAGQTGGATEIVDRLVKQLDMRSLVQTSALKALDRQIAENDFGASRTAAAARKVGRGAERTTKEKVAPVREDADWRTMQARAKRLAEQMGENTPEAIREVADYKAPRGGSQAQRAERAARVEALKAGMVKAEQDAAARATKAAKKAEEDKPPTLEDILKSNEPPEGREKLTDYNERMGRVVASAQQAGVADPFLERVARLLKKEGGITRAERDILEVDAFKLRAKNEVAAMAAEKKALDSEIAKSGEQARATREFRALGGSTGRMKARAEFDDAGAAPTTAQLDLSKLTPTKVDALVDMVKLAGDRGPVFRSLMTRLLPHLRDVRVFTVPPGQLRGADGLTTHRDVANGQPSVVFIEDGLDPARLAEVIMHEAVHVATGVRFKLDARLAERLTKLRLAVIKAAGVDPKRLPYELSTNDEFIAHAMTSQSFQADLAGIPISDSLAAELGIKRSMTLWDGFVEMVRRAFGISDFSALEAAIRLGGSGFTPRSKQQEMIQARLAARMVPSDAAAIAGMGSIMTGVRSMTDSLTTRAPDMTRSGESKVRTMGLGFMTASDIVENFQKLFDWTPATKANSKATMANPLAQVQNALARQGVRARELRDNVEPIIKSLNKFGREHPQSAAELNALMQEATAYAIHPDVPLTHAKNKHLQGKNKRYWQAAKEHPRLYAEYQRLTARHTQVAPIWSGMADYFSKSHADMSKMLIKNLLENRHYQLVRDAQREGKPLPAEPNFDAMTTRFVTKKQTQADTDWLGVAMGEHVTQVRRLARVVGPYFPQRRFGDFVVQWKETDKDEHTFTSEADAKKFAEQTNLLVIGTETRSFDAAGKRLSSGDLKDPNTVAARVDHVVRVQNNGLEFFDTRGEAEARRRELAGQNKHLLSEVERRREAEGVSMELMPDQLQTLVRSVGKMDIGEDRIALTQRAIEQAATRLLPSTSAKSALLRRRNVQGASLDAVRSTAAYANASANYLSKLEYAPVIHAGMDGMEQFITDNRYDGTGKTIARQEVYREMQARQRLDALDLTGGGSTSRVVRVLQSMSFVNFLASPAYTLINLLQQVLVTAPYLGARFGDAATAKALASANTAIFGKVMMGGAKQFAAAVKANGDTVNFIQIVRDQINKGTATDKADLNKMLSTLTENGLIDLGAGMELVRAGNPRITMAGKALQYTEDIARAMPSAAEVVNRAGSAIAAYRLARAPGPRGGMNHEQATTFALEAVRKTQFDYTPANTARFMDARRSPILAMAMTFRKYSQGMYMLLGTSVVAAMKGATPQERTVARKTLTRLLTAHMVFAGALGLPLEPIKVALGMVNFAFGGDEPWDYEREVRQLVAEVVGPEVGEVITRGLPRAFGADLSSRVGLDSMIFAKGLEDFKPKTIQTAMFELVGGAPASMLLQPLQAADHLRNNDPMRAAEMLVPKGVRDVIKAARFGSEGVRTTRGEQIDPGLSGGDLFWQALGIQPAKVAEMYERRDAIKSAEQGITSARQRLMRDYADASPNERQDVWTKVREWNAGQPPDARVTMDQIIRSMQERQRRVRDAKSPEAAGTYLPDNRRFLYGEGEFANVR